MREYVKRRGGSGEIWPSIETYFKKCLFLYAESFAVQGDIIVSEGEMYVGGWDLYQMRKISTLAHSYFIILALPTFPLKRGVVCGGKNSPFSLQPLVKSLSMMFHASRLHLVRVARYASFVGGFGSENWVLTRTEKGGFCGGDVDVAVR